MTPFLHALLQSLLGSLRDLLPVIVVITVFQFLVLGQPLPPEVSLGDLVGGMLAVLLGLTLFVHGLQLGLFPVGEQLAHEFVSKASVSWLMIFAFALGFGTTVAEPALLAVAAKAAEAMAAEQGIAADPASRSGFALGLRLIVAVSVGAAVMIGVLRILRGWRLHLMIIGGYLLVLLLTLLAPAEMIGIAYDAGGVTTSTITVPMLAALGVGLASVIKGRNPVIDGFGLIAFASLTPILFVLILGGPLQRLFAP